MKEKGSISVPPKKVRLPRSPHFVGIGAWWGVQAIYGRAILASITQINGVTPIKKSSNKYLPWFFSRGSCSCVVCWISWKIPESYFSKSWDWDIHKSRWSLLFLLSELIIRWSQAIPQSGFSLTMLSWQARFQRARQMWSKSTITREMKSWFRLTLALIDANRNSLTQ